MWPLLLLNAVCPFPLNLVHKVKVALVEVVYPHVPILTSAGVSLARRIYSNGVLGGTMLARQAVPGIKRATLTKGPK